jgi:hypothetical protein
MTKKLPFLILFKLLVVSNFQLYAQFKTIYEQLAYVNTEWKNQPDIDPVLKQQPALPLTEKEMIQLHLKETENLLRKRSTGNLSTALKENRQRNLAVLHGYMEAGVFPVNSLHQNRQPYFIDAYNTYCAVGYLMQQSGADAIARHILETQNYSFLPDVSGPALMEWVQQSGLSFDELALIQPGYADDRPAAIIELHYNNQGDDTNEYLELAQPNGIGFVDIKSILLYDSLGILYKTLAVPFSVDKVFYYSFPPAEHFEDKGKIELVGEDPFHGGSPFATTIINYSDTSIDEWDSIITNGQTIMRHTSIGENETTGAGTSLTLCNRNGYTWGWHHLPTTMGAVNICFALPVTLSKFDYNISHHTIVLSWETVTEEKNDFYVIERSNDGNHFKEIGKIAGAGNSNSARKYSFTDNAPAYINHYRLKQIDADGNATYSKILYVKMPAANPISISPNVVRRSLQLTLNTQQASLTIYNFSGMEVMSMSAKAGVQYIDVSRLTPGKYLVRATTIDGQVFSRQFIKQ